MNIIDKKVIYEDGLNIAAGNEPIPAEGFRLTMTVDGVETEPVPGQYPGRVVLELTEAYHRIGAFQMAGADDYNYRAGLFVDESGINEARSASSAIVGGTFGPDGADSISVTSTSPDFNGIIISGPIRYHIKNSHFSFPSHNDGHIGCDFTGYGAVIYALNGAEVVIENCEFYTEGVVRPCVYVDEHTNVILKNCRYQVAGGTLFGEYRNNAETDNMVAAPWVLGIKGNCRGANLMGFNSSLTIVDSDCTASGWGVVSTDIGTNQQLTIIDSVLTLQLEDSDRNNPFLRRYGPGYGTYSTGDYAHCQEFFYGVHFKVGTYGTIFTSGDATYASSRGEVIVERPDRYPGKELIRIQGQGHNTVIDSDGFGFMTHGAGNIYVTDGTEVNSDRATFLVRSSDVNIHVNGQAKLSPGNGIILQMADNDDELVGIAEDSRCTFNTVYTEPEGWPSENGSVTGQASGKGVTFSAENVHLTGNLFNGTGYYGKPASFLRVRLGDHSALTGIITATETRHVDENGNHKASFSSDEYYYIGSVENRPFQNGNNCISVTLTENSCWTVTGTCQLTELLLADNAKICAEAGMTLSVQLNGMPIELEQSKLYKGNIEIIVRHTDTQ